MARQLATEHLNSLDKCRRRTTLSITLGDDSVLHLATGAVDFNGITYLEKLAPVDALNLELTRVFEGINLRVSNITKVLGQNLINTPNILDGTTAVLGCYFQNQETNAEWHDVKVTGEIQIGDIDNDWINIFFLSKADAVNYSGIAIASAFPDEQIPTEELPTPIVNPIYNDIGNIGDPRIGRGKDFWIDDWSRGNYYLPLELQN